MDRVAKVKVLSQGCEVGNPVNHVVTSAGLVGSTVAAPVMSDHSIPVSKEKCHLGIPVVRRQRPTVAENDRLTRSPIFVEDVNAVFCSDRGH
jgi:hypothetical protein